MRDRLPPPGMQWAIDFTGFRRFLGPPGNSLSDEDIALVMSSADNVLGELFSILVPFVIIEEQY